MATEEITDVGTEIPSTETPSTETPSTETPSTEQQTVGAAGGNGGMKYRRAILALGIYLGALSLVLVGLTYALWPTAAQLAQAGNVGADHSSLLTLTHERRLLLLVIVVGMLGSVIGAGSSFTGYVGNKTFEGSWVWWYLLRPLLGCMLALLLYFVVQAGFLDTPTQATESTAREQLFYSAAAISGLAGMFSKVTADKLESVFKTILQSDADDKRADKMKENN